jgi:hypothetical protein
MVTPWKRRQANRVCHVVPASFSGLIVESFSAVIVGDLKRGCLFWSCLFASMPEHVIEDKDAGLKSVRGRRRMMSIRRRWRKGTYDCGSGRYHETGGRCDCQCREHDVIGRRRCGRCHPPCGRTGTACGVPHVGRLRNGRCENDEGLSVACAVRDTHARSCLGGGTAG